MVGTLHGHSVFGPLDVSRRLGPASHTGQIVRRPGHQQQLRRSVHHWVLGWDCEGTNSVKCVNSCLWAAQCQLLCCLFIPYMVKKVIVVAKRSEISWSSMLPISLLYYAQTVHNKPGGNRRIGPRPLSPLWRKEGINDY